jgi:hypothetical protein
MLLPGGDSSNLVAMLELLWPNPDRHAGANTKPPTLDEAQCVVVLAVTLVQWAKLGILGQPR